MNRKSAVAILLITSLSCAASEAPELDVLSSPVGGPVADETTGAAGPADEMPIELQPVNAANATEVVLEAVGEFGYRDEMGVFVVDLLERDTAYLGVVVKTPDGRPVFGAEADLAMTGASRLLPGERTSDEYGQINFTVVGGVMGLDRVKATIGERSVDFALNVISLRASGFPSIPVLEDGLSWGDLMQAQLDYKDMRLVATFPDSIEERAGKVVKVSGFMMPLEPQLKQKRFVLTSNPPSCFFHIPGGPAGAIEVLAAEGIEATGDPIVLEGRFEPQKSSEIGVVYRLLEARRLDP